MSLLRQLNANGVTAEDLEKAASVRLFEKAAHSESNYMTELRSHVDAPFNNSTNLNMEINPMDYIDLFEKQASDEGIDLDMLDDYELAELYNHFIDNVAAEGYDEDLYYDEEEAAYEKLAEAEVLGEVMADAYLNKLAADADAAKDTKPGWFGRLKGRADRGVQGLGTGFMSRAKLQEMRTAAQQEGQAGKDAQKALKKALRLRGGGAIAGGALAAGGAGYLLAKKRREKNAAAAPDGYTFGQGKKHMKNLWEGARATERGFSKGVGKMITRGGSGFGSINKLVEKVQKANPKASGEELKALVNKALTRRGRIAGAGALVGAGAGAYALKKRNEKKASLIEELALEKAASYVDGDYEMDLIDEMSDELAYEILLDAGYDVY